MNFLGIGGSLRASNNFIDFQSKCCTKGLHHKNSITGSYPRKAQLCPSMVDLVVKCYPSSHDQQGNIGNDIEHYEDNFE
jgi:hypothetical protein